MQTLYVFNPEHDLAMAENARAYDAPRSALRFAHDCDCLPMWYADGADVMVQVARGAEKWCEQMQALFPCLKGIKFVNAPSQTYQLMPWGYDLALHKRGLSVDDEMAATIRCYSHRAYGRDAVKEFQPYVADECMTLKEVQQCVKNHTNGVVMKAPWSGSGRGIVVCKGALDEKTIAWIERLLSRQGSVLIEPYLHKIQDFAMEFSLQGDEHKCTFNGYSLFATDDRNVYRYNYLLSNEEIEHRLGVEVRLLHEIRDAWMKELPLRYKGYTGYIGVDMMTYEEGGRAMVNPLVEVNLRTTMGLVARRFFDRYVSPSSHGVFRVEHMTTGLMQHYAEQQMASPLAVKNGRIESGLLSLTPVREETQYYIWAEITA